MIFNTIEPKINVKNRSNKGITSFFQYFYKSKQDSITSIKKPDFSNPLQTYYSTTYKKPLNININSVSSHKSNETLPLFHKISKKPFLNNSKEEKDKIKRITRKKSYQKTDDGKLNKLKRLLSISPFNDSKRQNKKKKLKIIKAEILEKTEISKKSTDIIKNNYSKINSLREKFNLHNPLSPLKKCKKRHIKSRQNQNDDFHLNRIQSTVIDNNNTFIYKELRNYNKFYNSDINSGKQMIKKLKKSIDKNKFRVIKKIMKIESCTLAGSTSKASIFLKNKVNQDNFFIEKHFLKDPEQFMMGICDGHGLYGESISKYISQNLVNYINNTSTDTISKAFVQLNNDLTKASKINCCLSGSTCCTIITVLDKIICANVGDTKAVLGRYENGSFLSSCLSRDHKPSDLDEMKRVLKCGGIIKSNDKSNIDKIWLPNSDIPGLEISRSFGDTQAHSVGVICEPEIKRIYFNGTEKFIILASKGIWKYIDPDEAVDIVHYFYLNDYDASGALQTLVKEAYKRWKIEEYRVEDITAILIFFS